MIRGTFANIRLQEPARCDGGARAATPATSPRPDGPQAFIYDASEQLPGGGHPARRSSAGKEYGSGSSRDWAAKGTNLLGVKAVIAESFERIHRSNLIGMGVLPLQFPAGETADVARARRHRGRSRSRRHGAERRHARRRPCTWSPTPSDALGRRQGADRVRRGASASTRPVRPTTTATAASCSTCSAARGVGAAAHAADGLEPHGCAGPSDSRRVNMSLLESIQGPRDLDRLTRRAARPSWPRRSATFLIAEVSKTGGHLGPEPRRRRADHRDPPGLRLAARRDRVRHRAPDATCTSCSPGARTSPGCASRAAWPATRSAPSSVHDIVESSHASQLAVLGGRHLAGVRR